MALVGGKIQIRTIYHLPLKIQSANITIIYLERMKYENENK
jgi:hypothetical protein